MSIGERTGKSRKPTLGQREDHEKNADTVPAGFPEDAMDVDQIQHFFDHLVCPRPPLAPELGTCNGIQLIVNLNLVLLILVCLVLQGVPPLPIFIDAET